MTTLEHLKLQLENWQIKAALLNTQQTLFGYQAKEVNDAIEHFTKMVQEEEKGLDGANQ